MLAEKLFSCGDSYCGAWNFGPNDDESKTVEWIVRRMCNLWGENAAYEITELPQPHEAFYLKLDCSKAKTLLKWKPKWDLEKSLISIVGFTKAWLRNEDMRSLCFNQIDDYFNM